MIIEFKLYFFILVCDLIFRLFLNLLFFLLDLKFLFSFFSFFIIESRKKNYINKI